VSPYIPYGLLQTMGEMCAKFGSDRSEMWICIRYKQTFKQTFIFICKITETYKFYSMFKRPEEAALKVILKRNCRTKRGKNYII